MADTYINLIFGGQQGGGNESDPEVPGATPNPEEPEKVEESGKSNNKALTVAKAMAVRVGKQGINMVVSRVGQTTRSNLKQQKVNAAMKTAGYGIGIFGSLATQNYAAAAMIAVSAVVDVVNQTLDYNYNKEIEGQRLSILKDRASISRSR